MAPCVVVLHAHALSRPNCVHRPQLHRVYARAEREEQLTLHVVAAALKTPRKHVGTDGYRSPLSLYIGFICKPGVDDVAQILP